MWKFRWRISSSKVSLFRSPTRAEILIMWILGSSPSSSDNLWMRRSCSPRGWRPLVVALVPYPTLTLGGQHASSCLILLGPPRARLHAGFTRLYRQLSCRLNACLLMFATLLHFRRSGRRLETGLCVYVDSIQKDPEVFLLDLCRVLYVSCSLAYGLNVDSLNGNVVSFDSDFYAVKYLSGSGGLFASEVFDFKRSCF